MPYESAEVSDKLISRWGGSVDKRYLLYIPVDTHVRAKARGGAVTVYRAVVRGYAKYINPTPLVNAYVLFAYVGRDGSEVNVAEFVLTSLSPEGEFTKDITHNFAGFGINAVRVYLIPTSMIPELHVEIGFKLSISYGVSE